jgi:myo-inositol-1(or 4)-monophosphatase
MNPIAASAEYAATEGATVAMQSFRSDLAVETKTDRETVGPADVVTEADRAAQERIIGCLESHVSGDFTFVAEEGSIRKTVPESESCWVIDPIDGTDNYIRGLSRWATSVAALKDGDIRTAATIAPALGDAYLAVAESTAIRNNRPVTVSDRTDMSDLIVAPIMLPPLERRESYSLGVQSAFDRFADVRRTGSLQLTLALVAAGAIDIAVTPRTPNPWDSIAGVKLVNAAGGCVTDAAGQPWSNGAEGLVASNGRVHEKGIELVDRFVV